MRSLSTVISAFVHYGILLSHLEKRLPKLKHGRTLIGKT
jgi:hypothetical protein